MTKKTELHVCNTGQLYSFRPIGASLEDRSGIFSAMRYGEGPDAVLVTFGIQGEGYFYGIRDHFDEIMDGVKCIMGYVWPRHVRIYRRVLRDNAEVTERWQAQPYGEDGPTMSWIEVVKL